MRPVPWVAAWCLRLVALSLAAGCGGEPPPMEPDPLPAPISQVAVTPPSASLVAIGATVHLSARATDTDGVTVADASFTWTTSDPTIATVDDTGLVTAQTNGTVTIRAVADGVHGTASIWVSQVVDSIAVTPEAETLTHVGDSVQLSAEAFDANGHPVVGKPIAWTSADEDVIEVTPTGLASAAANGTTTVSASADSVEATVGLSVEQRATHMDFSLQPTNRRVGLPISVEVRVLDAGGTPVASGADAVFLAIGSNPGGSALSGPDVVDPAAGRARFDGLSLDQTGTDYTLVASSGSLPDVTSAPFRIGDCPCAYIATDPTPLVSVVEVATTETLGTVTVGSTPRGIAITPDTAFAYVASSGGLTVSVIDLATDEVIAVIPNEDKGPVGIAVSPDGSVVYAVNRFPSFWGSVSVIDTGTNTRTHRIEMSLGETLDVAFRPDGAFAYVTSGAHDRIAVVDVAGDSVFTNVGVGGGAWNVAVAPTGDFVYVGTNDPGTVTVIDATGNTVVDVVSLGALYVHADVAVTHDGAFVYASGDDEVVVIDTSTNTVATTIPVARFPGQISITPDGARAWVTHSQFPGPSPVTVIDIASHAVTSTFALDGRINAIAIKP